MCLINRVRVRDLHVRVEEVWCIPFIEKRLLFMYMLYVEEICSTHPHLFIPLTLGICWAYNAGGEPLLGHSHAVEFIKPFGDWRSLHFVSKLVEHPVWDSSIISTWLFPLTVVISWQARLSVRSEIMSNNFGFVFLGLLNPWCTQLLGHIGVVYDHWLIATQGFRDLMLLFGLPLRAFHVVSSDLYAVRKLGACKRRFPTCWDTDQDVHT